MTNVIEIRTPYDKRDSWMQSQHQTYWMQMLHRQYGDACHLNDIDCMSNMWIESHSGELIALAEFKNDYEQIELYKYKPMITLANNSKIPFYIVAGYRHHGPSYYVIPMNSYCKELPTLDKPRFMSEVAYIQFLHYLRKEKVDPKVLIGKSSKVPKDIPLPNIRG